MNTNAVKAGAGQKAMANAGAGEANAMSHPEPSGMSGGDESEPSPMDAWIAELRCKARDYVFDETLDRWSSHDDIDIPADNFAKDRKGTYIYDAVADEVRWQPSRKQWPVPSLDVMMFALQDTGRTNSDGSRRTFQDELNWMNSGYFQWRDIIDFDGIQTFIVKLEKSHPHIFEKRVSVEHELQAFCDIAEEKAPGVSFDDKARWMIERTKGNPNGQSPLMAAAKEGCDSLVDKLFALSDCNALNREGMTAADIAAEEGHGALAKRIRAYAFAQAERQALVRSVRRAESAVFVRSKSI